MNKKQQEALDWIKEEQARTEKQYNQLQEKQDALNCEQTMSFKSEYKRMMNQNFWKLTIFEFIWMSITLPIWCIWYQIDTSYFEDVKDGRK